MSLPSPINGTEQYLQAVHQELVGLRADLAADRAERIAVAAAARKAAEPAPAPAVQIPAPTEQLVELKEPAEILPVHADRPNLPPLSDEAGKAMARALDDGRPKAKAARPRRGDA
jgi:hypothetical protein